MNITKEQVDEVLQQAKSAESKAKKWKEKGEEALGHIVQTIEVSGASFGFGYLAGRKGDVRIMGAPVPLLAAAGLHLGSFLGVFGKYSEHGHNLGDGSLAAYTTILGVQIGTEHKQAAEGAPKSAGATSSGWAALTGYAAPALGSNTGSVLGGLMTKEELEALRMASP